jgi:hypothetical protein
MICRICRKTIRQSDQTKDLLYRASTGRVMRACWHRHCEQLEPRALLPLYAEAANSENAHRYTLGPNAPFVPDLAAAVNPFRRPQETR